MVDYCFVSISIFAFPSIYLHPGAFFFLKKEILQSSEIVSRKILWRIRQEEAFSGPIKGPGDSGL